MRRLFKCFEDMEEFIDEEGEDFDDYFEDEDVVVVVAFPSSKRMYYYFTDRFDLEKGNKLKIKANSKNVIVKVLGYSLDMDSKALRKINILERINALIKKPIKNRSNKKMDKITKVTESAKDIIKETKDVALKMQYGGTIIASIRVALLESDAVPANVKELVSNSEYSDFIIGNVLKLASDTFLESETIKKAADATSFVGAVSISSKLDFIQILVEGIIAKAMNGAKVGMGAIKEAVKENTECTKKAK